jgi:hypothetical protein
MNQPIIDSLPDIYKSFLPSIFFADTPKETIATCHDCIMCKDWEGKKARGEAYYTPQGKCCTYYPQIPNYLIGSLLSDTSEAMQEGVSRVQEIIRSKVGITPTFLCPPVAYAERYKAFYQFNFGLAGDMICPLNDRSNGNCTIWKHRNAVCSQWFCKSVGDQIGRNFWDASRDYLDGVEQLLSIYTAKELGIKIPKEYKDSFQADERKGGFDEEKYQRVWGEWYGKEEWYYKECNRLVSELTSEKFEEFFSNRLEPFMSAMQAKMNTFKEVVKS